MNDPRVRPYEASDEPALRALSTRLSEGFAPWRDASKVEQTISGWVDDLVSETDREDRIVLVAELDDLGVVGFIAASAQDHYIDGRDAYIGELAVASDAEGRGIGKLLVSRVHDWAGEQGCGRLTLQTGAANDRARRFYERLDFDYEDVSMARSVTVAPPG